MTGTALSKALANTVFLDRQPLALSVLSHTATKIELMELMAATIGLTFS
jgi:hypothetical protein